MAVNREVKGMLAKLLATEDIIVEHKKVETACFNVHTRVLTLPMWEKASNNVYDLLVAHEVGHALFTSKEDWSGNVKVPQQFVNVVEDARVEKLMKRRYAGLAKTFYNGYKELNEEDFFQLEEEDLTKFNLADKVNLYFKVGNFLSLDFNSEEKEIVDLIASTETFADVLIASEKLYKYCKEREQDKEKVSDINTDDIAAGNSDITNESSENVEPSSQTEEGEMDNKEESDQKSSESSDQSNHPSEGATTNQTSNGSPEESNGGSSSDDDKEPVIQTLDNLENKIKDLANMFGNENVYVELPEVNLETIIGKNDEVHKEIDFFFNTQQKRYVDGGGEGNIFSQADANYRQFKLSAQKEVNYLVKEFECKKAAEAYSRASTARTGVLDTARLHSYKFSEDIFKKISVIPDGKNHGLVFVLDWSGSMSEVLLDTCKQLFNLIWFCRKVSIPFEVYAFTNEWRRTAYDYEKNSWKAAECTKHYVEKEGLIKVHETFSLMNILTSRISSNLLEHQLINIWRHAYCFCNHYNSKYSYSSRLCLSGTPLNEALISLHQILPKFQRDNKLQKVHCIVLTDGDAPNLPYHVEIKRGWENTPYLGIRHVNHDNTFLRDRKLGTTYSFPGNNPWNFTDVLLRNLKDKFTTVNFIGIRILPNREMNRFVNLYHNYGDKDYHAIVSDWKKLKSFTITKSGYHAYFGLSSVSLSQDSEFDVKDGATKSQIKNAFAKSLGTKKMNKKVLGEFISLIA